MSSPGNRGARVRKGDAAPEDGRRTRSRRGVWASARELDCELGTLLGPGIRVQAGKVAQPFGVEVNRSHVFAGLGDLRNFGEELLELG